jgi:hypothetical protein
MQSAPVYAILPVVPERHNVRLRRAFQQFLKNHTQGHGKLQALATKAGVERANLSRIRNAKTPHQMLGVSVEMIDAVIVGLGMSTNDALQQLAGIASAMSADTDEVILNARLARLAEAKQKEPKRPTPGKDPGRDYIKR